MTSDQGKPLVDHDHIYDVIVIGAGVEGSATAYYLTSRHTKNVLLLEQFDALHTRGSSHGGSRVIRKAYHEPFYTKMMDTAYKLWSEIERESGMELYIKAGMLVFGDATINPYITSLQQNNIPHNVTNGKMINSLYPNQLNIPNDYTCVIDDEAGILKASKAVLTLQSLFVRNGGQLLDRHQVTKIVPTNSIVTIVTNKRVFRSKKIIVTAGAWTNQILQTIGLQLPLQVIKTEVFYWSVQNESSYCPKSFPTFYWQTKDNRAIYGIPVHDYHGLMKVCYHYGIDVDPNKRDCSPHSHSYQIVSDFLAKYFKGVDTKPAILEPCMYTMTPDRDPFLDRHPEYPNIVIGAGFSGHGFKLGPVVGQILSELALDKPSSYDLSRFQIIRTKSQL